MMNSAVSNVLRIIPGQIIEIILDFDKRKRTGQIMLNFTYGKIGSADTRQHFLVGMVLCSDCGQMRHRNDKYWTVRDGRPFCPRCDTQAKDAPMS